MTVAFLETTADRHAQVVGGLTALERKVREVAKAGATKAIVAGERVEIARPLPIPVEYVAAGTPAPEGARCERADVVAGVELVDEDARKRAEWALIRRMNKSYEGPVDALINWRFSMRITRVLSRASLALTPNHVTVVAILVGLCASLLAFRGGYPELALAGVLLEVNSILDSCDGELARLRYQFSKLGQWLDNLSDDLVDNLFLAAVGWAIGGVWFWIGLGAGVGRLVNSLTQYVATYLRTGTGDAFAFRFWFEGASTSTDELYSPKSLKTWLRSIGRRDTYIFLWMIALVCNFPYWVVVHGAVISAVNLSLLFAHFTVFRSRWK